MVYELKINNIEPEYLDIINKNICAFDCTIQNISWKSKYNSYVVYDFKPFCSDGFEINIIIQSENKDNLLAFKHYYNKKVSTINYLNNCYRLESYKKIKPNKTQFDINKHFS